MKSHTPPYYACEEQVEFGKKVISKMGIIICYLGNDGRNVLDRHPIVCVKVPLENWILLENLMP
jgi:hypothetical protein